MTAVREQPPVGLANAGSTCYMNAALQAMASSEALVSHVADLAAALAPSPPADSGGTTPPPGGACAVRSAIAQAASAVGAALRFLLTGG